MAAEIGESAHWPSEQKNLGILSRRSQQRNKNKHTRHWKNRKCECHVELKKSHHAGKSERLDLQVF